MDSWDLFHQKTRKNAAYWARLKALMLMFVANLAVYIPLCFGFRWWERYLVVAFFLSLIYVIMVLFYDDEATKAGDTLFADRFKRLRDWRDFYTSEKFIRNSCDYNHAPISDGDYLRLIGDNREKYMKFYVNFVMPYGALSYCPTIKRVALIDLNCDKELYSAIQDDEYITSSALFKIQTSLEKDGYIICGVYNKFGDIKWWRSDEPKSPKKVRCYLYKLCFWLWIVALLIAFISPFLPMVKYL